MAVAMTASQAQEPGPGAAPARKMFGSLNPATGQPIATFPVCQREDADVAVSRAREAARWWGGLGWRERRARLLDWKSYLTGHMDELAQLMHEETGSQPTTPRWRSSSRSCTSTRALLRERPRVGGSRGPWGRAAGGSRGPRAGWGWAASSCRAGGSRPAVADRERSRMGPMGPRDPSAPRVAGFHHWLATEPAAKGYDRKPPPNGSVSRSIANPL
jgi:Aldehyde dehydrogenase family